MMEMEPLPRRIVYSQAIRERIKELASEANRRGRLKAFREALVTLQNRLETRPLPPADDLGVFGEPRFHLSGLDLLVSIGVVSPLAVHFGVSLHPQTMGEHTFIGIYVLSVHLM